MECILVDLHMDLMFADLDIFFFIHHNISNASSFFIQIYSEANASAFIHGHRSHHHFPHFLHLHFLNHCLFLVVVMMMMVFEFVVMIMMGWKVLILGDSDLVSETINYNIIHMAFFFFTVASLRQYVHDSSTNV